MIVDLEQRAKDFDKLPDEEKQKLLREKSKLVHRDVLEFIRKVYGAYEATKNSTLRFGSCYGV